MNLKRFALLFAALGLLLLFLHPRINPASSNVTENVPRVSMVPARAPIPPVRVHDEDAVHVSTIRRNLFAFVEVSAPRVEAAAPAAPVAPTPVVQTVSEPNQEAPREPEFPFRYIGRFGPERDPIAVFVANGDVVNARIGELIAGQFRLTRVGIESVEIASGSGTSRRVALQP
jgi:hypothetical protein